MRARPGLTSKALLRYVPGAVVGTSKGDGGGSERRAPPASASVSGRKGDRPVRGAAGVSLQPWLKRLSAWAGTLVGCGRRFVCPPQGLTYGVINGSGAGQKKNLETTVVKDWKPLKNSEQGSEYICSLTRETKIFWYKVSILNHIIATDDFLLGAFSSSLCPPPRPYPAVNVATFGSRSASH